MPPRMITSTSACIAIRASNSLYGSPDTEKIGSFCETTRVLKRSIIGIPVRIILRGTMRCDGLTEGPPIGIRFSCNEGPLSRGFPEPENRTCMGCPRKRTVSPVEIPRPPAKTCKETISPFKRFTSAREVPNTVSTSARSP